MLTAKQIIDASSHQRAIEKGQFFYRENCGEEIDLGAGGTALAVYFGSNEPFIRDGLLADINPGDFQLFSDLESKGMYYIKKELN